MVKQISHKQLSEVIEQYYNTKDREGRKNALIVYGSFGLGKSAVIRQKAKAIAESKDKEFREWNRQKNKGRAEIFDNPEKFFVLMDIRLSEYDSSDIKGLPDFKDGRDSIEFKPPYWATFLELENSDGILLFDEINLATPLVISSVYKIIYDRVINGGKINDDWLIIGCGNLDTDRAYTTELVPPVRDRGGEVELLNPSVDDWTEWAVENGICKEIIGFVNFKPSTLHRVDFSDNQKYTTERGWERTNTLIQNIIGDYKKLGLIVGTAISEGISKEFVAFCKLKDVVDLDKVVANPKLFASITDIGVRYFVTTSIAEQYKEKKLNFDKVADISYELDLINSKEFVTLLWRMCRKYDTKRFDKDFIGSKNPIHQELGSRYGQYLL